MIDEQRAGDRKAKKVLHHAQPILAVGPERSSPDAGSHLTQFTWPL
jgi:hypothetical protein